MLSRNARAEIPIIPRKWSMWAHMSRTDRGREACGHRSVDRWGWSGTR